MFELDLAGAPATAASAGWRTTGVLRAPRRFDLMGLVWAHGSHAEAQLRARRRGGRWTRWVTLHELGDHGPDRGRLPAGTDPAFTGAADEFQLRLRGAPRDLRARFVRAQPTARLATRLRRRRRARRAQAGAPPAIIPRSAWGGDSVPPREPPIYGEVQLAFVHHTVTANDYTPEESPGIVLAIARYHRNSQGWNDIGYQFLVDKYGQIFEGRAGGIDQAVVGAQAQGWNSTSTGVACLGDFTSIAQTPEGMDALARLIGWKLSVHGVPDDRRGDRDLGGRRDQPLPGGHAGHLPAHLRPPRRQQHELPGQRALHAARAAAGRRRAVRRARRRGSRSTRRRRCAASRRSRSRARCASPTARRPAASR